MTTSTGNFVCDNSSLANFKSWAMAISAAFAAFGWVQTADTGQVVWGAIAAVPAGYVYEVWKANDALAGTMPIYVKVEYGSSTTVVNVRFTVGTGSSGAGVINGVTMSGTPWQVSNNNANQSATTFPCFFSGDAGEFRMWMWASASGTPSIGTLFVIERSKDTTGAKTNEYVTALSSNQASNTGNQQTIKSTGAGNKDTGIIGLQLSSGSGTGSSFGTVAALPVFPVLGKIGNPMLGVMLAPTIDAASNSIVTVNTMYGATHTYVSAAASNLSITAGQRSTGGFAHSILMRYE